MPKSGGNEARSHGSMNLNKVDREELTKCLRRISGASDQRSLVCRRPTATFAGFAGSGVSDLDLVRKRVGGCEWLTKW